MTKTLTRMINGVYSAMVRLRLGKDYRYILTVPVLRQYVREVPVTRRCFDAALDSSDEVWAAEASRHPVFRLDHASR